MKSIKAYTKRKVKEFVQGHMVSRVARPVTHKVSAHGVLVLMLLVHEENMQKERDSKL